MSYNFSFRCRVAYPHLHSPHAFKEGDDETYHADFVIAQNDPIVEKIVNATNELIADKLKGVVPNDQNMPLKVNTSNENFAGHYVLRAKSKDPRPVLNPDKSTIMDPAKPADGDWVIASIQLYSYSVNGSVGVTSALNGVLWQSAGEKRLGAGGPPSVETMFGEWIQEPEENVNPFA